MRVTLLASCDGSRTHTCFFLRDFPLELVRNPKVSALKYLNLLFTKPMVQQPLSMAEVAPFFRLTPLAVQINRYVHLMKIK